MKTLLVLFVLVAANAMAQSPPVPPEDLINQLANTEEFDFGFSSISDGFQFLPRPDASGWNAGITGPNSPPPLGPILVIVQRGAAAIPMLVGHLDDNRPTKIKPLSELLLEIDDDYDFNKRTRHVAPQGVNIGFHMEDDPPPEHQITVGDLCFVALGQIVNRNFDPIGGKGGGGVISSPTSSPRLLAVIRADYSKMTPASHKEQLIEDVRKPDSEERRNAAITRVAYYYPEELDELVLRQLKVPTYNSGSVDSFLPVLDSAKSLRQRKQILATCLAKHAPTFRDGIILRLFMYIDTPIWLHDVRGLLIQLFGYTQGVTEKDAPYFNTWSQNERARFIESLGPTLHPRINAVIYRLFSRNREDSELELQCIKALPGTGHDKELIEYCKHHLGENEYGSDEFRHLLTILTQTT